MAVRYMGDYAPYNAKANLFGPQCTWVTGSATGVLRSDSFGSCVGLVLFGPNHGIGVVAHFAGSFGALPHRAAAEADTQEILRAVCPVQPGIWDGWVFGGKSLRESPDIATTTRPMTRALIDLIRRQLLINPYIPVNRLASRRTQPEMRDGEYVGHAGVSLDLATGKVTWQDG